MIPTWARALAANAVTTAGGAASASARRPSTMAWARVSMLRARPAPPQQRTHPAGCQPSSGLGGWGGAQHREGVAISQLSEGLQRRGKVLAQGATEPVGRPGPVPDEVLVGPGEDRHALRPVAVTGDRTVVVAIGADQFGEHLRVSRIGLRARQGVTVPIARRRSRVDGVHRVAGLHQRLDPQAPVGLDSYAHLAGIIRMGRHQLMEPGDAHDALRQAP